MTDKKKIEMLLEALCEWRDAFAIRGIPRNARLKAANEKGKIAIGQCLNAYTTIDWSKQL